MKIRLMVSGFLRERLQFQQPLELEVNELENLLPTLAEEHSTAMQADLLDMIELDFQDGEEPFRIGTNPAGMVWPIEIDLSREE